MKNSSRSLLLALLLSAAASANAQWVTAPLGRMPPIFVTVTDSSGHQAFQGRTNASGMFATGKLQPGEYTVKFINPELKRGSYALMVYAGKDKVVADPIDATKLARGGVAMRVKVAGDRANIAGNISNADVPFGSGIGAIKVVKGKRYVWVGPETGSNMGGRWVEEGSAAQARPVGQMSRQGHQNLIDRGNLPLRGD